VPLGIAKYNPKIFVSYRRDDAGGYAGRLYDHLVTRFPKNRVFMDVDAIPPGTDFARMISEAVASCDVLIALIGRRWLNVTDEHGTARLSNPDDFVRIEIEAALNNGTPIIPVLVGGASMPTPQALPDSLRPLALRQAVSIQDNHFRENVRQLITVIRSLPPRNNVIPRESLVSNSESELLSILTLVHVIGVWPIMMAAKHEASMLVLLLIWATGPVLGELSRRRNLSAGMFLGFMMPYLPFHIMSLSVRLGLMPPESSLSDLSIAYRVSAAVISTALGTWCLRGVQQFSGMSPRPALPLAAVIPLTFAIAIIVQLALRT
jgi:hypothetical protein